MNTIQTMPQSIRAEQHLLGAILNDSNKIIDAIGVVNEDDFYKDAHKIIFKGMKDLFTGNKKIDIITLAEKLKDVLTEVGGLTYISELAGSIVGNNVKEYAEIIREKANKRKIIKTATKLMEDCYKDKETTTNLVNAVEDELFKISLNKESRMEPFNKVLEHTVAQIEDVYNNKNISGVTGINTGFRDLNKFTGGLQKQDLIILAARPSMGKTTLAVNIATNVSKTKSTAIFSLEMSREQLARKIISSTARIDLLKLNTGILNDKDWTNMACATGPLANNKLFIDDTGGLSVSEIKAKCKKIKLKYGLDLVIIDYLQLMQGKAENRTQEISGISRGLKQIGKELDVTVIALSQLSRAPETRTNHRPMLSDLRESGSIEQDADIVMFLYRDEYYDEDTEEKNIAECIFAKNRNGRVGTVKLAWLGQFQKFGQLDYIHSYPSNTKTFEESKEKGKQEVMKVG